MSTTTEGFWLAMSQGGRLRTLDRVECLDLLPNKLIGRLAYVTDDGPRIVPLNYSVTTDAVIVRTLAYGEVARSAMDRRVAFEIDDFDDFRQSGWSVLVLGQASLLTEAEYRQLQFTGGPQPWAAGPRTLFMRIPMTTVTGRQVMPT